MNKQNMKNKKILLNQASKPVYSKFGPNLKESKQIETKNYLVKKLIHYDCKNKTELDDSADDIPNENEIYIKENLLEYQNESNDVGS